MRHPRSLSQSKQIVAATNPLKCQHNIFINDSIKLEIIIEIQRDLIDPEHNYLQEPLEIGKRGPGFQSIMP